MLAFWGVACIYYTKYIIKVEKSLLLTGHALHCSGNLFALVQNLKHLFLLYAKLIRVFTSVEYRSIICRLFRDLLEELFTNFVAWSACTKPCIPSTRLCMYNLMVSKRRELKSSSLLSCSYCIGKTKASLAIDIAIRTARLINSAKTLVY